MRGSIASGVATHGGIRKALNGAELIDWKERGLQGNAFKDSFSYRIS